MQNRTKWKWGLAADGGGLVFPNRSSTRKGLKGQKAELDGWRCRRAISPRRGQLDGSGGGWRRRRPWAFNCRQSRAMARGKCGQMDADGSTDAIAHPFPSIHTPAPVQPHSIAAQQPAATQKKPRKSGAHRGGKMTWIQNGSRGGSSGGRSGKPRFRAAAGKGDPGPREWREREVERSERGRYASVSGPSADALGS